MGQTKTVSINICVSTNIYLYLHGKTLLFPSFSSSHTGLLAASQQMPSTLPATSGPFHLLFLQLVIPLGLDDPEGLLHDCFSISSQLAQFPTSP